MVEKYWQGEDGKEENFYLTDILTIYGLFQINDYNIAQPFFVVDLALFTLRLPALPLATRRLWWLRKSATPL